MSDEPLIDSPTGDPSRYCEHRWRAPRGDCLTSIDVEHVCALWAEHSTPHWCPCRAYADA